MSCCLFTRRIRSPRQTRELPIEGNQSIIDTGSLIDTLQPVNHRPRTPSPRRSSSTRPPSPSRPPHTILPLTIKRIPRIYVNKLPDNIVHRSVSSVDNTNIIDYKRPYDMNVRNTIYPEIYIYWVNKNEDKIELKHLGIVKLNEIKLYNIYINHKFVFLNVKKEEFTEDKNHKILKYFRLSETIKEDILINYEELYNILYKKECDICFLKIDHKLNNYSGHFNCDCKNKTICNDCLQLVSACPWCRKSKNLNINID